MNTSVRHVLLYHAECKLCRFTARVVVRLDRQGSLALLGLADPEADPLLEHVPEEGRCSTLRLATPDDRLLSGGAAALGVLERLPATRTFARFVPAAESLYEVVARNRDRLGRLVRDGAAPRRYP